MALTKYLHLWELLDTAGQIIFDDLEDTVRWRWTTNGTYSASSAYRAMLLGRIPFAVMPQVWKTKAIPKCRLHVWMLLQNKCLNADNLAKSGWPHNPECRLCMTTLETATHLSATYTYSISVWTGKSGIAANF